MSRVADLDNAAAWRCRPWLWIAPHQLPVEHGVVGGRFDELGHELVPA